MTIDLNLDAGEGVVGEQTLFDLVTSVNIACGGHVGDAHSMRETLIAGRARELTLGAHPSYPDRDHFGRRVMSLSSAELAASLTKQIKSLQEIAHQEGCRLHHVKPHGALYNQAAFEREVATAFLSAVRACDPGMVVVGLARSPFLDWARAYGLRVAAEGFADRAYESDGRLRDRSREGAIITDSRRAGDQALSLVGKCETICIHGDTDNALEIARGVRLALAEAGVAVRGMG